MAFGKGKKEDPADKNPALKQIADSVHKYNEEIKKRKDVDQATKDRIITSNLAAYEAAKDRIKKKGK
jgi:hypothetical protein